MLLEVKNLNAFYGRSHIIYDVSLNIKQGEIVCLLGRNGAGKTTTLKSIVGLVPIIKGTILFKGSEICGMNTYDIVRMGIAYVPDDSRVFPDLSVYENLEIVRKIHRKRDNGWSIEKVCELFPVLMGMLERKGSQLSGGEKKMLAIGRALMQNPDLLLLDEPSEGLAPIVLKNLINVILKIKEEGVTILLADQNIKFSRRIADRGYIIEKGVIQYEGSMNDIWENKDVVRRYLSV